MGENGSGGQYLDVIGSAVREFPDLLTYFPGTICDAEPQIPRQLDIRRQAGHRTRTLRYRDVGARDIHAWPDDDALCDGIAHGDVIERAIHADVAHRGETREKGKPSIGDGLVGGSRCGSLQDVERLGGPKVGEVSVGSRRVRAPPSSPGDR
jgi:hypothetical protein